MLSCVSRIYIYATWKRFFLINNHLVRDMSVSNQYFHAKICSRIYINNTYTTHANFFLKTIHLVRDTPVSNQYVDVKICRICICWTWIFFPMKNHTVRDTRVFNQYYSYTIYVWLWYKLTFLITITVHNVFKNTLTFSCLQYFEQIRFVIFNFLLQKTWRNIQSCSTIIFLFATFSNILKYKYICNFKVNYYITCHWILEIYYFFYKLFRRKGCLFTDNCIGPIYHYWFIVTRVLVINLSSKESYFSYQHNYMCMVI